MGQELILKHDANYRQLKRAYGLSLEDLDALKLAQGTGNVKMIPCNQDGTHKIPAHEAEYFYVVEEEAPHYNEFTGVKDTKPQTKKYNIPFYRLMVKTNFFAKKVVRILHDPTKIESKATKLEKPIKSGKTEQKSDSPGKEINSGTKS